MTKKFVLTWCDVTEYRTVVEASTEQEAREIFDSGEIPSPQPTGWCEMEPDSLDIKEQLE